MIDLRMPRAACAAIAATFLLLAAVPAAAQAQTPAVPDGCEVGTLPHGALSLICLPEAGHWNGELVVFAHGYVAPGQPLGFPNLGLPDGTSLPALVGSLGFAFATTSYRQNGLAILEGVDDIRELVAAFNADHSALRTYITGASEGGLVATLLAERSPRLFTAALATCGPIGDFRAQVNYFQNFRVLFDYFFPGVIPGSPIHVPAEVTANWNSRYVPAIIAALAANPARAVELLKVADAPFDPADPRTIANTALEVLWYNAFSTNDAVAKLGGNPFGNLLTVYLGSSNDLRLNLLVKRFTAAPAAVVAMRAYQTSGNLHIPLVTLHTTADDQVPVWHELLYLLKLDIRDRGRFVPIPIVRYGHCNFTTDEVLKAFLLMAAQRH
jgi:pimeloyl-ACP methyl ester carboxylesterase